ncbi:MAG: response regulator transcription factor [Gemmatimonadaceae bacterium]
MTEPPKKHVLIVEDSFDVANAYRILFEAHGYRVSVADHVAAAVEQAVEDQVDFMLLDLSLPDGSGLDVLAALRAGGLPRVTVALTGHDDAAVRRRCLDTGCTEVLVKPVSPRELLAKMAGWMT